MFQKSPQPFVIEAEPEAIPPIAPTVDAGS